VGLGAEDPPADELADEYRPGDSVFKLGSAGRDMSCRDDAGEGGTASAEDAGATIAMVLCSAMDGREMRRDLREEREER
jgi:hypothetical protein